ncbi:molecular chaperone HtpG [bacterium]|nr:molecular chaperone HtpG [bacterium]
MAKKVDKGTLSIHTENIFPIIKKWLYSEHDIFFRELISNAIDAMNKRVIEESGIDTKDFGVEVKIDKKKKTITFSDTGIGMTEEEIEKYINQIAFSGAEDFVEKYKDVQANIIGHFGLGFYSSFIVANKVTIDTLSYKEGAKAAGWSCEGSTEYEIYDGKRKEVGTTITIHVNDESEEFLEEDKVQSILEKYCSFMSFPVKFNDKVINEKPALWNKKPNEATDEEYKEFYRNAFKQYDEPLFWIHLNVDYPFNLKGILYFPKFKNQLDVNKGEVKLFCNNVFVADNLKDLIPEFLLLLKGGIDIPDIPLNVSRSFLQSDSEVKKISNYIVKKVADHFKSAFKDDREKYASYWKDISDFIKYGLLTNEDFFKALEKQIVYKTTDGKWLTIEEYLEANKTDAKPQKIYYAPSENTQVSYIEMLKQQNIDVIYAESMLDSHLFQKLEMSNGDVRFVRVDSEINDDLVEEDSDAKLSMQIKEIFDREINGAVEASFGKDSYKDFLKDHPQAVELLTPYLKTEDESTKIDVYDLPLDVREKLGDKAMKTIFEHVYTEVQVETKKLKAESIPAMIVFDEFMRRFQEMNAMMAREDMDMLKNHKLILNTQNPTIKKIVEMKEKGEDEKAKTMVNFVHELALLEQKPFSGEELKKFIADANKVIQLV